MLKRKSDARVQQLHLFHPPRSGPEWYSLPQPIRDEVVSLLASLFRAKARRASHGGSGRGGRGDE